MTFLLVSLGSGLLLAALCTASPLTVLVLLAAAVFFRLAGRGLPVEERRQVWALVGVALAARFALVGALFLAGMPNHNDLSIGGLAGDEAYYLSRALRARDMMLRFSSDNYDYFVSADEYGRTSYLELLKWLQVVFGPTPYGMRLLNGLFFVTGATVFYRTVRTCIGSTPAIVAFATLLFLPSLFFSSVSLLKESLYFLAASALFATVVSLLRSRTPGQMVLLVAATAAWLWLLDDLRRGAVILLTAGVATGLLIRAVGAHRRRVGVVASLVVSAVIATAVIPSLRDRAIDRVESLAKTHAGHVFTVGHGYKLMDEGFYVEPAAPMAWSDLALTAPEALRFLVRAGLSFLLTPLPWEMRGPGELAYLPELLLWYLMLAFLPVGIAAAWKRDPLVASLLVGFALPTAVALALTNGNVGTLLRLRGLVTPYVLWLGTLGLMMCINAFAARSWPQQSLALAPERPVT